VGRNLRTVTRFLSSRNNYGLVLRDLGRDDEAGEWLRRALDGRRRKLGDDDPSTLTSVMNMVQMLMRQNKVAEAEPYDREALEGRRRTLGEDHPDTLISLNDIGVFLARVGKLPEGVEVDNMNELCVRPAKLTGKMNRILGEHGRLAACAADQTNHVAAEKFDCRNEIHRTLPSSIGSLERSGVRIPSRSWTRHPS
jgi:Tetratricopeptide repeat